MELYAINFYNVGLFIYSITQIVQIKKDQELLVENVPEVENADTGAFLAAQIMLPCVIGTFIPVFAFLTRKLVKDFGWRQYRITGGSIKLQKVFFAYDILLLLIKFSIFFLTGFTVIDLVLTEVTSQGKLLIPIIGSVAAFGVALSGFYGVRYEIKWLTVIYQVGTLAAVAYVGNRLYEAYNRSSEDISNISRIEVPFIMYSCASFFLLFGSFAYGIVCMMNFGTGLKEVLDQEKKKKLGEFQPPEIDLDA
ncbi:hypothetical protein HDU79_011236 [Rhizoclosmatium sp. JEL0117]|nr:hypothetical protein HDU79_011236 [Rhizoclosmatium sp. JEL0117]